MLLKDVGGGAPTLRRRRRRRANNGRRQSVSKTTPNSKFKREK